MPDNLRPILELMREFGVRRLAGGGFEIELGEPPAPAAAPGTQPPAPRPAPTEPEEVCVCGHPLRTEHTADGCLHGCPVSICEAKPGQQPVE